MSLRTALIPLGVACIGGCVLAGAGAGAGGAIYFTSRGVESVVVAPVDTVADATARAFERFRIERTELTVEGEGAKRRIKGRRTGEEAEEAELAVTVDLEEEGDGSTHVEVTARESLVTWDKEFAREVIEKIVEYSGGEAVRREGREDS